MARRRSVRCCCSTSAWISGGSAARNSGSRPISAVSCAGGAHTRALLCLLSCHDSVLIWVRSPTQVRARALHLFLLQSKSMHHCRAQHGAFCIELGVLSSASPGQSTAFVFGSRAPHLFLLQSSSLALSASCSVPTHLRRGHHARQRRCAHDLALQATRDLRAVHGQHFRAQLLRQRLCHRGGRAPWAAAR